MKNLNICACVGVWKEGETLHYTFDNLLRYCNHIAVLADCPDEKTEKFVLSYKEKYPDIFEIGYSTVPPLRDKNHVRRRTKVYASQLNEEKLALIKKINEKEKVDILLSPDSDEVFTDNFPQLLKDFWESSYTSINARPINVYDKVDIIVDRGMASHYRVYKYVDSIHFTPWRYRGFYYPYRGSESMILGTGLFVHLNKLAENKDRKKIIGNRDLIDVCPDAKLWKLTKPAWELTHDEYLEIISSPPTWTLKEYCEKFPSRT